MTNRAMNRRRLLAGLGAHIALPLLPSLPALYAGEPRTAGKAGNNSRNPRLITMFHPNGVHPKDWTVKSFGKAKQLSRILTPIVKQQSDIVLLSGIDQPAAHKTHVQMAAGFLTGGQFDTTGKFDASLDCLLAKEQQDSQAHFPQIVLGCHPPRQGDNVGLPIAYANTVTWASSTQRIFPEINPRSAFDRLFASQTMSPERAAQRRSILDNAIAEAADLRKQLGRIDQRKLDEYLQSVRSVESRTAAIMDARNKGQENKIDMQRPEARLPTDYEAHLRLMLDIGLLAIESGTTNIATFMMAHGFSRQNFPFLNIKGDHHGVSHHKRQAQAMEDYAVISTWYQKQASYVLDRLKGMRDSDGKTILHNSLVLFGSSMKDGNGHVRTDLPLWLAGQAGGRLRTGRMISCPKGTSLGNLHYSLYKMLGGKKNVLNGNRSGIKGLT